MSVIARFLFPMKPDGAAISLLLLGQRVLFGSLLLSHGVQKYSNYAEMCDKFPDPLGVGHQASLMLAIFAELFCSLGFIFGAFYRLVLIPMIFTMGVAFFVVHGETSFSSGELPFSYMMVFILMYFAGPGRYSLDRFIAERTRDF